MTAPLDLSTTHRLHVIGAGGPGMSAIAIALAEMGHDVSGVDIRDSPALDQLRARGVTVHIGHSRTHVHGCDAVTASTAIPQDLDELDESRSLGITTLRRAGMLASICAQAKSIAIAGTHGKTTTTSMVAWILDVAGQQPSFVIGGDVHNLGTGARWTGGEWFVVEADESDGTHRELPLYGSIVTNIDEDHLELYGDLAGIERSFAEYLAAIPGPKVVCADNESARRVGAAHGAISYGTSDAADYRAVNIVASKGSFRFAIERDGTQLAEVHLPMRGIYNVRNATGAFAMAVELGVNPDDAADALARFGGVARRFDIRGVDGGATFVDDYAHLPAEINAVLTGARNSGDDWQRIVAVFQPNRFHRIADMWQDYADAFESADVVVLTDIYASGTPVIDGVTGKLIVDAVLDAHPDTNMVWLPQRDDLIDYLAKNVVAGDVCISMGCGDVAHLPTEVLERRAQLEATS